MWLQTVTTSKRRIRFQPIVLHTVSDAVDRAEDHIEFAIPHTPPEAANGTSRQLRLTPFFPLLVW